MKQYEYPDAAITAYTRILGFESSNPRLTRNYTLSDVALGVNIYNTDGLLLADRTVDLNSKKLMFLNGNVYFGTTGITGGLFKVEISSSISGIAVFNTSGSSFNGNTTDGRLFTGRTINNAGVGVSAPFNEFYDYGNATSVIPGSVLMEYRSTTKGVLGTRMTYSQMNAIASPEIGLEVYVTDSTEGKYIYKSTGWTLIG